MPPYKNNKISPSTIALIEIGGSHAECLLSQMHAIKSNGFKIVLICTIDIRTRNPIFEEYVDEFYIVNLSNSRKKNRDEIKNIWKKLQTSCIEKAIFNTAQGNFVRNLCLYALFNKIEFIGIIHTTLKFKSSFTQIIINWKIKKYLLLSEHLLSTITPPKGVMVDYFYPIRYPHFDKPFKKDRPIVTIVGGVENQRRDLTGFAKILIASKDIDVTFVFLGQTSQYNEEVISFRQIINKYNLMDRILSFDDYVSQEVFDTYLRNTDLVLPLVHPNTESANQYFKNQISGAMTIAFGYKIPMLIHEEYKHIIEMNDASFYYNESTFPNVLITSLENRNKKSAKIRANSTYDVKKQEDRYSQFIFSHSNHLSVGAEHVECLAQGITHA